MRKIYTEIAPGDLADKITILEIKKERIKNPQKLANISAELAILQNVWMAVEKTDEIDELFTELRRANELIWDEGDAIRIFDRNKDYGSAFVKASLQIHHENDKRAALKRKINNILDSSIVEEKSYDELA